MTTSANHIVKEVIHIKNMVCSCCKTLLQEKLEDSGVKVHEISLGKARISFNEKTINLEEIKAILKKYGFDLLVNKEEKLVADIKLAVIELIHHL